MARGEKGGGAEGEREGELGSVLVSINDRNESKRQGRHQERKRDPEGREMTSRKRDPEGREMTAER